MYSARTCTRTRSGVLNETVSSPRLSSLIRISSPARSDSICAGWGLRVCNVGGREGGPGGRRRLYCAAATGLCDWNAQHSSIAYAEQLPPASPKPPGRRTAGDFINYKARLVHMQRRDGLVRLRAHTSTVSEQMSVCKYELHGSHYCCSHHKLFSLFRKTSNIGLL